MSSRLRSAGLVLSCAFSLVLLAACGNSSSGGGGKDTLVVLGFGGNIQDTLQKATESWQKQHQITVKWEAGTSVSNAAKAVAEQAHPDVDVVLAVNTSQYIASQKGAWAKLDPAQVPNLKNVYPVAETPNHDGIGIGLIISGIFYDPKAYADHHWNPPTSYASLDDYLDDSAYCGRIGMLSPEVTQPLEAAWVIGKGDVPAGIKTLAKLKKCIPNLVANVDQYETQIGAGQYVVGIENQLHTVPLIQKGASLKFVYPSEGTATSMTTADILKNSPHKTNAASFINELLTPDVQRQLSAGAAFAPVVKGVELTQQEIANGLPTQQDLQNSIAMDYKKFAANQEEWINMMDAEFS